MLRPGSRASTTLGARAALASLCLGVLAPLAAASDEAARPPLVALHAAHIFDAVTGRIADDGYVLVRGTRIEAAGSKLAVPEGAQRVELGDATLLPGFIDAHVHMDGEMGANWYLDWYQAQMRFPAESALYAAKHARSTLEAGFTTVRDLGSTDHVALGLRNAIEAGVAEGPRMLVANYAIGSTGGHADSDPLPEERMHAAGVREGVCNGPEECRAAVRYQVKYGADVIKFMPSGGVLSLSDPVDNAQLTQEEMNAIVSEAHAWGRKAAAHCHGDKPARMAIAAGVDSIEHGSFLEDDTLQLMKQKHVYLVPTLSTGHWIEPRLALMPAAIAAKARAAMAHMYLMYAHAVKIGVPIALGTDAGVGPHGSNAIEFSQMAGNGASPAQALLAGTAAAAELLGVADRTGTLQAGKLADVVAVPGNVLDDLHATEHPLLVMKEGRIYVGPRPH